MEETRDDMIKEESEVESNLDNQNIVTDSFVEWTRSFATGTSSRITPASPSSETLSSTPASAAPRRGPRRASEASEWSAERGSYCNTAGAEGPAGG